jgi:hypothetical protein
MVLIPRQRPIEISHRKFEVVDAVENGCIAHIAPYVQ